MHLISCRNVSKVFRRHAKQKLLRDHVLSWWPGNKAGGKQENFYALKQVSFDIERGESVAVIGTNGAGKSTLLSILTGLAPPDEGSVEVNGTVAALLELGSGFHPDLTGRENVYLNASLLGFTEKQTDNMFESIVDFSGISEFIDEPLRTYSSGMVVRLAFSVAVNLDPDILIIDEVLAVGDGAFQAKCHEKISEMRNNGKTFVCVSHATALLLQLCDRGIWLDHGEVMMQGKIAEVLDAYQGRLQQV
jgi:ABC-type polysaccharide/polyol phosphate transport system ATPase subunit